MTIGLTTGVFFGGLRSSGKYEEKKKVEGWGRAGGWRGWGPYSVDDTVEMKMPKVGRL